jgi:hypothetical protein
MNLLTKQGKKSRKISIDDVEEPSDNELDTKI